MKKQHQNWWIDLFLLAGLLASFYLELTGVVLHQWLGAGLALLLLVHTLVHWSWVKAVARRFFTNPGQRNCWFALMDLLLLGGFAGIMVTGVIISTWLNLPLKNYAAWSSLHTWLSVATLGLTVLKLGFHSRWILSTTRSLFLRAGHALNDSVLVPAAAPLRTNEVNVERRRFLVMMGVIGAGSVLAVSNLFPARAAQADNDLASLATLDETDLDSLWTASQQGSPVSSSTVSDSITLEDVPEEVVIAESDSLSSADAYCTVECRRGCSFPGHCRRYVDQNGNGLCDEGECL